MWSRAQRARGVGRAPKVGESITSPMHAIDLMGRVTWIRAARSQKLSCRCFAVLCALILIFDVLGGLTDLWKHEFARKQTARVRFGVSLLACVSQLILEVHNACGLSWLRSDQRLRAIQFLLVPVSAGLIALTTVGGLIAALGGAAVLPPPYDHEWIFAVECTGVLILLCILWCSCGCVFFLAFEQGENQDVTAATAVNPSR